MAGGPSISGSSLDCVSQPSHYGNTNVMLSSLRPNIYIDKMDFDVQRFTLARTNLDGHGT